jgi:hypothetical protein
MKNQRSQFQLIWGAALVLAGLGVFYRIPHKIPEILAAFEQLAAIEPFVYFSFYLLGILLVGGGVLKIYNHFKKDPEP